MMEFLIIVCSATLQEEIDYLFEDLDIENYTHLPEATGAGKGGGIRLNDEVWPGTNSLYMIVVNEEQSRRIKTWVRKYREREIREGLKLISLPVNDII